MTVGGENKENKLPNMLMVACLDKPAKCESFINFCRILAKNVKYWPGQAKPWANCSNQMINYFLLICVETKILMFATINILTNYIFEISLVHYFLGEKKWHRKVSNFIFAMFSANQMNQPGPFVEFYMGPDIFTLTFQILSNFIFTV